MASNSALPPKKGSSKRVQQGFAALAANPERIAEIQKEAQESKFWDDSTPITHSTEKKAAEELQSGLPVVPQSGLLCQFCIVDPTCDKKPKKRTFSQFDLERHFSSSIHTREAQLTRALKMDGKTETSVIVCPWCSLPFKGFGKFFQHIRDEPDNHANALWERGIKWDSSEHGSERAEIPWEGFSTEGSLEGFSSPPRADPAYTGNVKGKGKGRAKD